MSVPTFVNSSSASLTTAGTGPLSTNVPASVANGDLLLACVTIAGGGGVPTPPAGWTLVRRGESDRLWLYARLASSEPASYNWSMGSSLEYSVIKHAYRPSSGSWTSLADAIALVWSQSTPAGTLPELPLPASMDMMLVGFCGLGRGSTTLVQPATYTMAENPDTGGTGSSAIESGGAYKSVTGGTAPSDTFTVGGSPSGFTIHLAVIDPATVQPRTIRSWYPESGTSSGTSLVIQVPFAAVGDLLVAFVDCGTATTTFTAPSGWSLVETASVTVGGDKLRLYTKIADGTEGTTQTWTASGTDSLSGGMLSIPQATSIGYHAAAPDATSDTNYGIPALTMPAQTPAAVLLGAICFDRGDRSATGAPSGYTLLYNARAASASGVAAHAVAYKFETGSNPAAGSFTGSTATTNAGMQVAAVTIVAAISRAYGYVLG